MSSTGALSNNLIIKLINKLLEANLTSFSSKLDAEIIKQGLDPLKHVAGGRLSPGTINIPLCKKATVYASYSISNMRGLGSLNFTKLSILSLNEVKGNYVGDIQIEASLVRELNANVNGVVGAKCGEINPHIEISGGITVESLKLTAKGEVKISIKDTAPCITDITMGEPKIDCGIIKAKLYKLGIFEVFADFIVTAIIKGFKLQILNLLEGLLPTLINKELKNTTPLCVK